MDANNPVSADDLGIIDESELRVLETSLARSTEDRLESNTSAVAAALELRRNLRL